MDTFTKLEEKLDGFLAGFEEKLKKERETNAELTDQKIDALKAEFKQQLDDYLEAARQRNASVPGLENDKDAENFSFAKTVHAILNNNWREASLEESIIKQAHKAIDTNTGGQGGYLIPVELTLDKIIKPAIANTVMKALGVTFWEGLTADVDVPEATSRPTLSWLADGGAPTAQNISFALKHLRPKEGSMLTNLSNKLLKQTPVAEKVVRDLMMEGVQDGIDSIAINGTGSNSQPLGILNASGTNTTNISSSRMTVDDVAGMIEDIEEQNFLKMGGGGLLTRPKVKGGLRRERVAQYSGDTGGMPLLNPFMSDAKLEETLGLRIRTTTNVGFTSGTLTQAVVGEWKEFLIGVWGGMRLKASDVAGTAFTTNQTWLVIFAEVDSLVMRPLAFDIASNVETNF